MFNKPSKGFERPFSSKTERGTGGMRPSQELSMAFQSWHLDGEL